MVIRPDKVIIRSSLSVASDFTEYAEKEENFFKNRVSDETQDRIMNLTLKSITTMEIPSMTETKMSKP
jgi:hypothetical protein